MGNIESPKSLYQIIEELKDDMATKYPEQREQIIAYGDNVPKVIDMFLNDDKGLDDICAFFRQFDQIHSGKMHPDVQRQIEIMRFLIRDQIEKGNIVMPSLKNGKRAMPEGTGEQGDT